MGQTYGAGVTSDEEQAERNKLYKKVDKQIAQTGSRLKGGRNTIPSVEDEYCSGSTPGDIVPESWHPAATSISWRVYTTSGGVETDHPTWFTTSGTGTDTKLHFLPAMVDAVYYGQAVVFSYIQRDGLGNVQTNYDFTRVFQTPSVFNFGSDGVICSGFSYDLILQGSEVGMEYTLYRDGTEVNVIPEPGTGSPLTFSVTTAGVYTMKGFNPTSSLNCEADMNGSATLTVNPLPVPVATNGGNVCLGDDIELFGDPDGLSGYTWTDPATTEIGTTQDVTISSSGYGVGTHTFTLTVEDANTCVNKATTNVTVFELPSVNASNTGPVCIGGDVTISSTVTGGQAPYDYLWTHVPSGTTYNTDAFTLNNVAADKAGEYQLVVTDANTCGAAVASTIVVINDNPTVTLPVGPTNVCEGEALTLTASPAGGSGTYVSYAWYHEGVLIPTATTATLTINPSAPANAGDYTVTVTDDNGCISPLSNASTINIIPAFIPTINNDSPVCEGGDVQLSCTSGPYAVYSWTGPNGFSSALEDPVVSGTALAGAGDYTLTVTDGFGCTGTEITTVVVNPNPTVTVGDNGPLCVGETATITATPAGGTGPYTYAWEHNSNPLAPITDVITINPVALSDAGIYSVIVTDANTCSSTVAATTNLVVNDNPTVSLAYNNPVCETGTLTLTATAAGGSGTYTTYAWTKGGVTIPGETNSTLTIDPAALADAGDYGVTVIDNSGCSSTEDVVTVVINALPLVIASSNSPICEGDQLELTGGPAAMATYSWTGPNGYTNGTQSPIVSANATLAMAGTYQLVVNDGVCTNTATTNVVINTVTAILTHSPANFTVCENTLLTFSANGADGSGTYVYEFFVDGLSQGVASGTNSLPLVITGNVNVEVEVTDQVTGCKDRADTDITMIANPVIAITNPNDGDEFCSEEPISFTFSPGYAEYVLYAGPSGTPTELYRGSDPFYTLAAGLTVDTEVAVSAENVSGCSALSNIINIVINSRPNPTITGNTVVCENATETYVTDFGAGQSNWVWTVTGGTIIGSANNSSVDVQWDGVAPHIISVNYDNSDGCAAIIPTTLNITVNALPVPTITGANVVCDGTTEVYTTETGMSNYTWNVIGGTLDSQDDANATATVTWNLVGTRSIDVTYTDGNTCNPATPTVYTVDVVALPSPTITGDAVVCAEHTYTYSTESGASNYDWQIVGGTITPTANPHEVDVIWNTTGAQSISINYDVAGCPAATATVLNVTVSAVPTPAIVGSFDVCENSTESYDANVLGLGAGQYTWVVQGGTVTGALDQESVVVVWDGVAPHTISLNYVNASGCEAVSPTVENITVNALPVPVITGPAVACDGTTVTYSTQTGMSAYTWNVTGGTLDSQDDGAATATVTWNVVGMQSIDVTYTDGNACNPTTPTVYPVEVVSLPSPTITGDVIVCTEHTYRYSTEAGASNYDWQIVGGTITPTANPHEIDVIWNAIGAQSLSVNYDVAGCPASAPTVLNVTVSAVPTPSIVGNTDVCENSTETYEANTLGLGAGQYTWLIQGGTPTGALDEESVEVVWDGVAPHSVSLNYVNASGCDAVNPTVVNITVNNNPVPTITGPVTVCNNTVINYTTESSMSNYVWTVTGGTYIDNGNGSIDVTWNTLNAQKITVTYEDGNACLPVTPTELDVTVNDVPNPTITGAATVCNSSTEVYSTETGNLNYVWNVVGGAIVSGAGTHEVTVIWDTDGAQTISVNYELGGGCSAVSPTVLNVTVNPLPTATFTASPGTSILAGTEVTFTANGSPGDEYIFYLNSIEVQAKSPTKTYVNSTLVNGDRVTVDVISTDNCQIQLALDISVYEGLIPYDVVAASTQHCSDESGVTVTLSDSQTGITYELIRESDDSVFGTVTADGINPVEWTDVRGTETYYVEGYNPAVPADRLEMNNRVTITENAVPQIYNMNPTGVETSCSSGSNITLDNSETDVNYQLLINSTPLGAPIAGDGNPIDFGSHNVIGIYSILATNTITGCTSDMNGTWQIDVSNPGGTYTTSSNVNPSDPTDGRYCAGGVGVSVLLSGSDAGTDYGLFRDGVATGDVIVGDGNALDFGLQTVAGTYTVAVNVSGCYFPMTGSVNVQIVNLPTVFELKAEDDGHFCADDADGVEIFMDDQETGIEYQLLLEGNPVGVPIIGGTSGTKLSFGMHITPGNYTVEASVPVIGCPVLTAVQELIIDPNAAILTLEGDDSFCEGGGSAILYINNPEADATYELWFNDGTGYVPTGDNGSISGGRIEWNVVLEGIYKVSAIKNNAITNCGPVDMNGEKLIAMTSLPLDKALNVEDGDPALCEGTTITVVDSEIGIQYVLISNISGAVVPGYDFISSGGDLVFPAINDDGGSYRVEAYNGVCGIRIDAAYGDILVNNPNAVSRKNLKAPSAICQGDGAVVIELEDSDASTTYDLYRVNNSGADHLVETITGDGTDISFAGVLSEGEYYVLGYVPPALPTDACSNEMLNRITVTFNPLPIAYKVEGSGIACDDGTNTTAAVIGLEGSQLGYQYFLVFHPSSGAEITETLIGTGSRIEFPGVTADGKYTVYALSDMGCSSAMKDTVEVNTVPTVSNQDLTLPAYVYCSNDAGAELVLADQEFGVIYEVRDETGTTQVLPPVTGGNSGSHLVLGTVPTGTYTIFAAFDVSGACEAQINSGNSVTVTSEPTKPILSPDVDTEYCYGEAGIDLSVTNTIADIGYQLINSGGSTVSYVDGNGGMATFPTKVTGTDTYTVRAISFTSGCDIFSDPITVTEKEELFAHNLIIRFADGTEDINCYDSKCFGLIQVDTLKLDMSTAGVDYLLYREGEPLSILTVPGTGGEISFGVQTEGGDYGVVASKDGCQTPMNGIVNLAVEPLVAVNDVFGLPNGEAIGEFNVAANDRYLANVDYFPEEENDEDIYRNLTYEIISTWEYAGDDGNPLQYTTLGEATINSEGKLEYKKLPNYFGRDSVRYKVTNTVQPERSDIATVFIFIGNVSVGDDKELLIPNAFSPNDDGINDVYVVSGSFTEDVAVSKLEVFNRWGTIVYRSKGDIYGEEEGFWDGTSNAGAMVSLGEKLPSGTYFYVFTIDVNIDGKVETKEYSGYIELRR